jgi:hypothetical protein
LINIGTIKEPSKIRFDDDVQKHPPKYYVEEPRSLVILEDTKIKFNMDCIANLGEPTYVFKGQLLHSVRSRIPFGSRNLLFLSHLPTRKT